MATGQMNGFMHHLRRSVLLQDGADLTDGQLLTDYIRDLEEAALAALVRRHGPMVWGVCRRILGNYHDAEDAFQATFLVLVRKAASIAPREMVANWLYGVARQTALKARATAAKRKSRETQVSEMPELAAMDQELWRDLQPLLDEELSRLSDKYRSVIVLCDLEGKTRKEAARQLGVPEGTVAGWLARARMMLAKRLSQRGIVLSGGAMAAVLAQNVASAGVPTSVVSSTIKAASVFAAGQAATAGAISIKVAVLTEGVLKAMLITKLKMAMAVMFVAVSVALTCGLLAGQQQFGQSADIMAKPTDNPAAPTTEDNDKLQGTWRVVSSEIDGISIGEGSPVIKDALFVFEKSSVTASGKLIHSPNVPLDPEDAKAVGAFALDSKKNPKEIMFTWEANPWLTKEYLTQRGVYALDGDSLKMCFSMPGTDMKPLPTEFSSNAGSKRCLTTFKRELPVEKDQKRRQAVPPELPAKNQEVKDQKGAEKERLLTPDVERLRAQNGELEKRLQLLTAEVERLRAQVEELKKRLQQQVRQGKTDDAKLIIKVYPIVVGLIDGDGDGPDQTQSLMRVLTKTIDPASWDESGGSGSIAHLELAGSLVIRQTPDNHKQVQELLEALRKNRTEQMKALEEKDRVRAPSIPSTEVLPKF